MRAFCSGGRPSLPQPAWGWCVQLDKVAGQPGGSPAAPAAPLRLPLSCSPDAKGSSLLPLMSMRCSVQYWSVHSSMLKGAAICRSSGANQ